MIAGLLLGACGSALFLLLQRNSSRVVDAQLSWGGVLSLIIIPVVLLNTGAKAPTQSLLGEIAVKLGPLESPLPARICISVLLNVLLTMNGTRENNRISPGFVHSYS